MERIKYSNLDLIGGELHKLNDKTFTDKALSFFLYSGKHVFVKIFVPKELFIRAEVFCNDIEELTEQSFDQNTLFGILYKDFLIENRVSESLVHLYKRLTVYERKSPSIKGLYMKDGEVSYENNHALRVQVKRKEALRGEVLLSDLNNFYPEHQFTLEMVFETIYIEFIEDIKRDGSHKAVKELLKRMEE